MHVHDVHLMCLYRFLINMLVNLIVPPGWFISFSINRANLLSATRARSNTRPNMVASTSPPHNGATTFLPARFRRSIFPSRSNVARPDVPPPSNTIFYFR